MHGGLEGTPPEPHRHPGARGDYAPRSCDERAELDHGAPRLSRCRSRGCCAAVATCLRGVDGRLWLLPVERSRAFSRRKDAERFRIEQDRARQLGQLYDAPSVRFGDFLAGWLGRHERRVRPSTFERAQSLRRFHVLSRYYVEEVTAARVEEIVMAGGTRQGHALRLIKRVLTDARARGQRVHEPVFAIAPPRTRRAIRDS